MPRRLLIDYMPKAGLVWQKRPELEKFEKPTFVTRSPHDAIILKALKDQEVLFGDANHSHSAFKTSRVALDTALASMMDHANTKALRDRLRGTLWGVGGVGDPGDSGLFGFMWHLRRETPWARSIPPHVFVAMVHNLIESRLKWNQWPQEPFEEDQHCKTARAIDRFLANAYSHWETASMAYKTTKPVGDLQKSMNEYNQWHRAQEKKKQAQNHQRNKEGKKDMDMSMVEKALDDEIEQEELCTDVKNLNINEIDGDEDEGEGEDEDEDEDGDVDEDEDWTMGIE
ncbi:hypothetical protein F4778DRAFT_783428 [Xylariomycetidae sp. FL2044]|nr:hypothetical protein F4778DRAFT_783428 [Xylariomycetidae sp. FL2044]